MAILSSHTLSGLDGTHAGGIQYTLVHINSGRVLFTSASDAGGRLSESVDLIGLQSDDRYEVVLNTAAYWESQGVAGKDFIDEIVLRLRMPDPDARYHLPVILSPNSYSIWRSKPEKV